jgi:signal transduction histidine kinase
MKMRLVYKIMISFMLLIILGGGIIAFTVNYSTSRSFTAMVRESDVAYAQELAIILSIYYQQTGTWVGVEDIITLPSQFGPQGNNANRRPRTSNPGVTESFSDHILTRGQLRSLPILLIDSKRNVLFSSQDITGLKLAEISGISVLDQNNSIIGTVFAGSMIGSELLPVQNAFLNSVKKAILFASIAVIISTFIIGYFLVKHITNPIGALHKASSQIAKGDFKVRVDTKRQDELGELTKGFNLMTESLEAAEKWKQQIIADSAHELRTPVSLIQGHLEMMLEGVYSIDKDGIQTIYDETLLLTSLISELQELSSTEAGYTSFIIEKISLEDLIVSVSNTFRAKMEENDITYELNIEESLPEITVDKQKLYQVLLNVISNSLKFTPAFGSLFIDVWKDKAGSFLIISIEDSGPGIALEERTKIFDRFYRIEKHRNRDTGGSGLGLAISNEIMNRHGGTIKAVDPKIGKGTRILLSLPV